MSRDQAIATASAEIISLRPQLQCSGCGASQTASCHCGMPYVPVSVRAREAVEKHPEKSDRAIAVELGVSPTSVGRARQLSTAGQLEHRVGRDGKKRKHSGGGPRIKIPNGFASLADALYAGIKLEENGTSFEEAAKRVGISATSYRRLRDIALLVKRPDLSVEDRAIAVKAMDLLERTGQRAVPLQMIRPLITRIWGEKGGRFTADKKRVEAFVCSMSTLRTVCTALEQITVPYLSEAHKESTLDSLDEARKAISAFTARFKRELKS